MKKRMILCSILAVSAGLVLSSCSSEDPISQTGGSTNTGSGSNTDKSGDTGTPTFDSTIADYDGETADDASSDVVGTDADLFWEANSFSETVNVTYSGSSATVTTSNSNVVYDVQGAYVTLDLQTNALQAVEVIVSGKSDDGQLKIYGSDKMKLTLNGVELTSSKGPAINNQNKKQAFVHLTSGTTNRLTDASSYSDDTYYISGASSSSEDRKGSFFSEGNLVFSGTGVLVVKGQNKHGIATDGYLYTRPGVTIAVTDAAKNAIHVKGKESAGKGIYVGGGLIYANTSATAGKSLKTDLNVEVAGGKLLLSTSGGSEYDSSEGDTSSPACIKADGDVSISGGTHTLKSTGSGGKGLNVDGALKVSGGSTTITTTGSKYIYNLALDLTSSPKGVKADGDITIDAGALNISVTGVSDGSEGLESKSTITINGGEVYVHAYDDAMNATTNITINGGKVYCYSVSNDGIDSNGTLKVTGGLVIASGSSAPEQGFDSDHSNNFTVTGGTLIGTAGSALAPSSSSSQRSVVYNGISGTKGQQLSILNSSGTPIVTYTLPRTLSSMSLLFSSPALTSGSYTVSYGGSLSGATDSWNGWLSGGTWSGGSTLGTFTSSSTVTTVGRSGWGGRPW